MIQIYLFLSLRMIQVDSVPHKMQKGNSLSGLLMRRLHMVKRGGKSVCWETAGGAILKGEKKIQTQHLAFLYLRKV